MLTIFIYTCISFALIIIYNKNNKYLTNLVVCFAIAGWQHCVFKHGVSCSQFVTCKRSTLAFLMFFKSCAIVFVVEVLWTFGFCRVQ